MRTRSRTHRAPMTTSPMSRRMAGASSSRATTARLSNSGGTISRAARKMHSLRMPASTWSRASRRTADRSSSFRPLAPGISTSRSRISRRQGLANERYLVAPRESRIDRYYYSTHDHTINPSWSPDGQRVFYVDERRDRLGHGLDLLDRRRGRRARVPDEAPARDHLGRTAGGRPGRQAHPVLELSRRAVAPALAHDDGRRRALAAHLRRFRPAERALVTGRQAHRLRQQ